ncbi:MAG: acyltransferase [Gammaproteobacteria bacterium]|nr:acyltransferase [Gammaproteobacteria bacterium]MAU69952.1 acyltransferase [Gammaproteobacteria bacterium]
MMSKKIKFVWKNFDELSIDELYAVLHLRQKVFIVEQDCPYLDADNSDQNAFHLLCYEDNKLIAYLRAFKPGVKYEGSSMGRIVTEINSRGLGLGKEITKEGVKFLNKEYPNQEIVISAQHRLKNFYTDLGFIPRGEVYLEDDIDHIQMYILPN